MFIDLNEFSVRIESIVCPLQELQTQVEEEQRQRDDARESYNMAERRCNAIQGEAEELRTALEQVSHLEWTTFDWKHQWTLFSRIYCSSLMSTNGFGTILLFYSQAERSRKAAENEVVDANDRVNELQANVSSLSGQKRKLESDINAMQVW